MHLRETYLNQVTKTQKGLTLSKLKKAIISKPTGKLTTEKVTKQLQTKKSQRPTSTLEKEYIPLEEVQPSKIARRKHTQKKTVMMTKGGSSGILLAALTGGSISPKEERLKEVLSHAFPPSSRGSMSSLINRLVFHVGKLDEINGQQIANWLIALDIGHRSRAQYISNLLKAAGIASLEWANDKILLLLRTAELKQAKPPQGATPISISAYHKLLQSVSSPNARMMAVLAMHSCGRMDEVGRISSQMISFVKKHVFINHHTATKTSSCQPNDLRFTSVLHLPAAFSEQLKKMMKAKKGKMFSAADRRTLAKSLRCLGLTDHSFKKGGSDILAMLASQELIAKESVSHFLKHKSSTQVFTTSTIGYVSGQGRQHLLQAMGMDKVASLLSKSIDNISSGRYPAYPGCSHYWEEKGQKSHIKGKDMT